MLAAGLFCSDPEAQAQRVNQPGRCPNSWCGEEGERRATAVEHPQDPAGPPPADRQAQGSTHRTEGTPQVLGGAVGYFRAVLNMSLPPPASCLKPSRGSTLLQE